MKIIHTSDLHLGSRLKSNLSPQKASERRLEILSNFNRLLDDAVNNGVKIVIIAGDLFDTEKITKYCLEEVLSAINNHNELDLIYLVGNHEKTAFIDCVANLPKNLKAVYQDTWQSFSYLEDGKKTVISCVNLTKANNGVIYNTLSLNSDDNNIVVLHGQIANYNTQNDGENIDLRALKDKNIDYLALGHYHFYDVGKLDDRGIYVYSGCLEGRGFDETGDKGYVLLDTFNLTKPEFIKFAKRTLLEVEVDVTNLSTWAEIKNLVLTTVNDIDRKNLLKIILKGYLDAESEVIVFTDELTKSLSSKFYYVKIYNDIKLKLPKTDLSTATGIKGEFIKMVSSDCSLTESERMDIIQYGLKALNGDDL